MLVAMWQLPASTKRYFETVWVTDQTWNRENSKTELAEALQHSLSVVSLDEDYCMYFD